jgi:hypothetical protein
VCGPFPRRVKSHSANLLSGPWGRDSSMLTRQAKDGYVGAVCRHSARRPCLFFASLYYLLLRKGNMHVEYMTSSTPSNGLALTRSCPPLLMSHLHGHPPSDTLTTSVWSPYHNHNLQTTQTVRKQPSDNFFDQIQGSCFRNTKSSSGVTLWTIHVKIFPYYNRSSLPFCLHCYHSGPCPRLSTVVIIQESHQPTVFRPGIHNQLTFLFRPLSNASYIAYG